MKCWLVDKAQRDKIRIIMFWSHIGRSSLQADVQRDREDAVPSRGNRLVIPSIRKCSFPRTGLLSRLKDRGRTEGT